MNRLALLNLDDFENIRIGYLYGLWDYQEFRRKFNEMICVRRMDVGGASTSSLPSEALQSGDGASS